MSFDRLQCPSCGETIRQYRNPFPTVDIIIEVAGGIVLIERKNEPYGWALPGGFVDYGECLENAARREAMEETGLQVENLELLGCYSDPARDARMHCISTVYIGQGKGIPTGGDDAKRAEICDPENLPSLLCFDHRTIIEDYLVRKNSLGVGEK